MKIYSYSKCGTCVKALKWLDANNITYEVIPIRERPPSVDEITKMIETIGIKRLFNTSGKDYREMKIKDKLPGMSPEQMVSLLHSNGNLIKRPFVISSKMNVTGFKEEEWERILQ